MTHTPRVLFTGKFSGLMNVKYTYLQACAQDYGFSPLFLAGCRHEYDALDGAGLPVLFAGNATIDDVRQSALIVVEDFPHKSALGATSLEGLKVLQLWHGIPLKKIGFPEIASSVNMRPEKAAYLTDNYSGYTAVPSTSPWMTENLFSKVFKAETFPNLGFARNDILLRAPSKNDMIGVDVELYGRLKRHAKQDGKLVVYMPTFRDTGGDFLGDGVLDPLALDIYGKKHNIIFLAKFHPNLHVDAFKELSHFVVYSSQQDIYPLLPMADALVTDYSSIYFDYMLVDKPLIFFAYDKDKYLAKDREMFFDYHEATPGTHVLTQEALLASVHEAVHSGSDPYALDRQAWRDKLFTYQDSGSAARLCEYIRSMIGLA